MDNSDHSIEASSPGRVFAKLTIEQKLDRKRILLKMQQRLIRSIEQALWTKFRLFSGLLQEDVDAAAQCVDANNVYQETVRLIQHD